MELLSNKEKTERPKDRQSVAHVPQVARLLSLRQAAAYCGLSYWTLRDYCADGLLPVVKLPCGRQRGDGGMVTRRAGDVSARKILIDRKDLDALIEAHKEIA